MSTATEVVDILGKVTEIDDIGEHLDLRLYDNHVLDSFLTVELIVALESRFGIEIPPSEFEREAWATPRQIVAYVEERVGT